MRLFFRRPLRETIAHFLEQQKNQPYSYSDTGASLRIPPEGFVVDHRRICLGEGESVFNAACQALRCWHMFEMDWVHLCWPETPITKDSIVAILVKFMGIYLLNASRIVYVLSEEQPVRKFAFAYGTLLEHVESGEERFSIEWLADNSVWYDLYAFSRPGHWLVRLGYPLARRFQKRFGKASLLAMKHATTQYLLSEKLL
ncbi:MAG: DUF1990 domain-containing protein [Planctomycetota bacterium]